MKIPFAEPDHAGSERARRASDMRTLATEIARLRPQALTRANGEEADLGPEYPTNFTKGLEHNKFGVLNSAEDYRCFVEAINSPDRTRFEKSKFAHKDRGGQFAGSTLDGSGAKKPLEWRGWESPRAGHVYDLEGPDAGAVGMAPAPRVGSSELAVEMAEVYGLALLRDVPFSEICAGGGTKLCDGSPKTKLKAKKIVELIAGMPFLAGQSPTSSTPHTVGSSDLNGFEANRRDARLLAGPLTPETAFRGSTRGAMVGPYISQFMLIGANSLNSSDQAGNSSFPGEGSAFDFRDGFVPYGSIVIDQRTVTAKACLDYMTDWTSWLDVQNGGDARGIDVFAEQRRFITTPRDLATYVHYDALYEAYLNAALIMLGIKVPASKGFPENSPSGSRTAFATYGGPHILSLVTEVATRCLKAVRRQKFNYHRRARPEAIAGRLALTADGHAGELGDSGAAFDDLLAEIPKQLLDAVDAHNADQNTKAMADMRQLHSAKSKGAYAPKKGSNLLLPMAFPEGSPMHPAYGAGHATVAGGCVTMLKAFFEMFEDSNSNVERPLTVDGAPIAYEPNATGSALVKSKFKGQLTVQGELDKLAANISIGRNMAGVHYYSDYYDSLRMGERIAVGILMEHAPTYGEAVETTFKSFDGDMITITGEAGQCSSLSILGADGCPVSTHDWWLRHVPGEELIEDLPLQSRRSLV